MPKVLLIEDEASIRAVLKDILKDQKELKLEVDEAKDGVEGLAKLESEQYDVAFCDIKMPKMDGMEVLQKAKEKGNERATAFCPLRFAARPAPHGLPRMG